MDAHRRLVNLHMVLDDLRFGNGVFVIPVAFDNAVAQHLAFLFVRQVAVVIDELVDASVVERTEHQAVQLLGAVGACRIVIHQCRVGQIGGRLAVFLIHLYKNATEALI